MNIIRGKIPSAQKVVIYGPEGIGKTSFAACFPDPLFIDTEGGTKHIDVARLPAPTSWTMLLEQVQVQELSYSERKAPLFVKLWFLIPRTGRSNFA